MERTHVTKTVPMLRSGLLAAALLVGFASNALADKITLTGHPDYRNGPGGEFNVRPADAGGTALIGGAIASGYFLDGNIAGTANGTKMQADANSVVGFQTFCLEYNETISLGGTYNATIATAAFAGGGGAAGSPPNDPISIGTAYLYSLFATGALSGYNYTNGSGRAASADQLQNAFWYLEEERTLAQIGGSNVFVNAALAQFGSLANAQANNNAYNVRVLNLTDDSGALRQSQLINLPDGGVTVMLLSLGLGGLALLRRKSN